MLTTKELTPGERLLIWRRRNDISQSEAAKRLNCSLWEIRQWEAGHFAGDVPPISIGKLMPYESCLLMRKRSGMSLKNAADDMGVSRYWLTRMERGELGEGPIRLIEYWT